MTTTSPQSEWPGVYYDGVSATPHRVIVHMRPTGIQIIAQSGSQLSWQYQDMRQTQGKYSGEEIRFERGNGICETLVFSNIEILNSFHHIAPDQVTHFHNPARRRQRILLTILAGFACIPLLWAAFSLGIPWVSGPVTQLIPISWEEELGQFIVTKLAPPDKQCTDPLVVESFENIVTTLSHSVNSNPYSFHIHVVDSPAVNALAAPGGHILVFQGLLKNTQTAEEMAGVLAHEMQHILERHGMRLLVQNFSIGFVIGALSGDVSGIMTFGLQAAHVLQTLSYTRDLEEQADEQGVHLLLRSGVDPQGMLNFFHTINEKLEENENTFNRLSPYFTTHPSTEERIRRLKNMITISPQMKTLLRNSTDQGMSIISKAEGERFDRNIT